MKIDDIAYQRATRVAAIGLGLQSLIGLTLFLFGVLVADVTLVHAATYALIGIPLWLSLVVVFNQHKLERIEAKETDELQQQRMGGFGSAFDDEGAGEFEVAARRLRLMHKWLMPIVSWIIILFLAGFGAWQLRWLSGPEADEFGVLSPANRGWGLAICISFAAISFIFSRFVAGMSKQPAWQNLRGGAGYMVGNAVVLLGVTAGLIFTYFDNQAVIEIVAWAIPILMIVLATEIFLNFLLNLYRPRRPGEVPRPAFDSRLLSLLSTPDSIVRSINEAVNYQFGFDITSSWGYQLLLRATRKLALFAVIVLLLLNCVVLVEPQQQAVRLRGGEIVGQVHDSGLMFKFPWPIERAEVFDVSRVRKVPLTAQVRERPGERNQPILWSQPLQGNLGIEPFIVSTSSTSVEDRYGMREDLKQAAEDAIDAELGESRRDDGAALGENYALVEAEFVLHYRIRQDPEDGLLNYLHFASDAAGRRDTADVRTRALKSIALREVTRYLAQVDLDAIIADDRAQMVEDLRSRVQRAFDEYQTGVEVLLVSNPWIRPAGEAAVKFETLGYNIAGAEQKVVEGRRRLAQGLAQVAGSPEQADEIVAEIDHLDQLRNELDRLESDSAPAEAIAAQQTAIAEQNAKVEQLLLEAGGEAASIIADARADLWINVLGEEARLELFKGRLQAYNAGPEVYREYLIMDVLSRTLADARKYFVGIDPGRLRIDVEMRDEDSSYVFGESVPQSGGSSEAE